MTVGDKYELAVDMWDQDNLFAVARYKNFRLEKVVQSSGDVDYKLHISGYYDVPGERPAGDAMSKYDGQYFAHNSRRIVTSTCFSSSYGQSPGWCVQIVAFFVLFEFLTFCRHKWEGQHGCNTAHVFGEGFTGSNALNKDYKGIIWSTFRGYKHSLKRLDMKLRPKTYGT